MVTIFLCEDNHEMADKYSRLISLCADKNQINIKLTTFDSGEALIFHLSDSPNQADIIYMDILMSTINGMETAKQLRKLGCSSEIIFLTSSEDYVFEAFDLAPVQYLIKHATSNKRFEEVFLRAVLLAREKKSELFVCETGNAHVVIPVRDISYFEIWKRLIRVYYQNGESIEYYGTMEQLEQQMLNRNFVRVHRSYMVNIAYITRFYRNSLSLKTGEDIPIGVTYLKQVKKVFADYINRISAHGHWKME